ncbi:MotA/TolQ/ExbB proton channel family protein [Aestuariirhabdus sp. LZHN29]|uniref:MotA/TolQ/ExbB proton channel family protein n=1 Tax=Aestuariirhabdus sp. LZHN29 TaxID=3417462 RepID=UPI003CEC30EE
MEMFDTIVRFIQDGGAFMYPIMLTLAIGIAIAVERYLYLTRTKMLNLSAWNTIFPLMSEGKIDETIEYVTQSKAQLSNMLEYALSHLVAGRRADDVERMLEEGLMEVIPRLEKRTGYLATFANIATLLGLLGTILGLIAAFSAVANADPAEKANLLSSSISVAMNTTAFGLVAAIPLLLLHALLSTKTNEIVDSMDMATVKLSNLIQVRHRSSNTEALQAASRADLQTPPQAEVSAREKAEAEARKKAEEKAKAEALRKEKEARRKAEEAQRKAEEAKQKAAEAAKAKAEAAAKAVAEAEAAAKAADEALAAAQAAATEAGKPSK